MAKAAVYYETGAPDVFRYEDVPDPEVFAGGVVLDVEAISIEGGDTLNRAGGEMTSTPHIVGYQCAGTITEVGEGVTDRHVGQRVVTTMISGSHAWTVRNFAMLTWPIPEGADLIACACVPIPFGTAHDCLFEFGHLQKGETVLIQAGADGVGLAAIQLAKRAGATVFATASNDERLARLTEFGMDHGINYSQSEWVQQVRELTDGRGVDLVVDSVGGKTLEASVNALAYRGRVSWVGNAGREMQPPVIAPIMGKNATITGVFLGAEFSASPQRTRAMIEALLRDVARGELKVVIDREFPLSEAAAAHAYIESRSVFGRVLLVP